MGVGRGRAEDTDSCRAIRPSLDISKVPEAEGGAVIVIPCSGDLYERPAERALRSARDLAPDIPSAIIHYDQEAETRFLRALIPGVCPGKAVCFVQDITALAEARGCGVLVVSADSIMRGPISWLIDSDVKYAANASSHRSAITQPWMRVADGMGFRHITDVIADPVNIWSRISTRSYYEMFAGSICIALKAHGDEASSHHMVFGTVLYRHLFKQGLAIPLEDRVHLHLGRACGTGF